MPTPSDLFDGKLEVADVAGGGDCGATSGDLQEPATCQVRRWASDMSVRRSEDVVESTVTVGNAARRLRSAMARHTKAELVDVLVELAGDNRAILRQLAARFNLQFQPGELVAMTRQAIADATAFDERDINRNFDYDDEAYRHVQQNLYRLIDLGQLRFAMELALELMAAGSRQVEMSDEGLMTDDIEACFKPVLEALRSCDLSAAEVAVWCTEMINSDRVGLVCNEELQALRRRFKARE